MDPSFRRGTNPGSAERRPQRARALYFLLFFPCNHRTLARLFLVSEPGVGFCCHRTRWYDSATHSGVRARPVTTLAGKTKTKKKYFPTSTHEAARHKICGAGWLLLQVVSPETSTTSKARSLVGPWVGSCDSKMYIYCTNQESHARTGEKQQSRHPTHTAPIVLVESSTRR